MQPSDPIFPTHTCFDDAIELIGQLNSPELQPLLTVVHAICKAPTGELYAHAWVERADRDAALFGGIYKGEKVCCEVPREEYRAGLQIQDETRYTVSDVIRENRRTNHFGPWIDRYIEKCSSRRRIFAEPGQ